MKIGNTTYRVYDEELYRKAKAIITAIFGSLLTVSFGGLLIWGMALQRGGFFVGGEWIAIICLALATAWQTNSAKNRRKNK